MLVYIRDFSEKYKKSKEDTSYYPKFHISWCTKLDEVYKSKRYSRYVVSQRNDGIFLLDKTENRKVIKRDIKLNMCKYCLGNLNYKGYGFSYQAKNEIFNKFTIKIFLSEYNTEIYIEPTHTSLTQLPNEYSEDWDNISYNYRKSKKIICQDCGKDCSKDTNELHVHHIDGMKSNNEASNLEVVYVKCHFKKSMHEHMLGDFKFKRYL
ncbi:MAG: HNH endonuclease signature motif containing protein [Cetobacterium sp.]